MNRIFYFSFCCLFSLSLIAQTPVAEYHFDNGSILDSSISGFDLISQGDVTPTADPNGNADQAISINEGNLSAGDADVLNMNETMTISCWVKFNSFSGEWTAVINKWEAASGSYYLGVNPDNMRMRWNAFVAFVEDPDPIEIDVWMHYVAIYDGQNMKLFRNGAEVASSNVGEIFGSNTLPVRFGAQSNNPIPNFNGALDDVYIFKAALSDSQVVDLYNGILDAPDKDLGVIDLTMNEVQVSGNQVQVAGRLYNYGAETITNFDLRITDGTAESVVNFNGLNLEQLDEFVFDENVAMDLSVGENKSITVTCENMNGSADENEVNDSRTETIKGYAFLPTRRIVVEQATASWCSVCPQGIVSIANMAEDHPGEVIGIAIHNQDGMAFNEYLAETGIAFMATANYDRTLLDELDSPTNTEQIYQARIVNKKDLSEADIEHTLSFDEATSVLTVEATIQPAVDLIGDYNLAVVITEDGVTGVNLAFDQANAFSGGTVEMGGFENLPDPVPAADMVYNNVARAQIGGYEGVGVFPTSMPHSQNYTGMVSGEIPQDLELDFGNLNVVTLLLDPSGQIVNAITSPLSDGISGAEEIAVLEQLKIYPNPSSGLAYLELELERANEVEVSILDLSGKLLTTRNYGSLQGAQILPVVVSKDMKGMYFLKVRIGEELTMKKVFFE